MVIAIIFIIAFSNIIALESAEKSIKPEAETKTVITADTIECFTKKNVCHAVGNAKAVRTNSGQVSTLTARQLTAYFAGDKKSEAKKDGNQSIEKVEAKDNVKLVFDNKTIKADRGVYLQKDEQIKMYGHVSATEYNGKQGRHLQGEYAVIEVKSGRYQLFPALPGSSSRGGQQVKILILDKGAKNAKK